MEYKNLLKIKNIAENEKLEEEIVKRLIWG
jgi:hypothetical protein